MTPSGRRRRLRARHDETARGRGLGDRRGEPRLADARLAAQDRHAASPARPDVVDEGQQLGELGLAPQQRHAAGAPGGRRTRCGAQRRLLPQDRLVQGPGRRRGVDPEVSGQGLPDSLEGQQGVRLPVDPVQRQRQQGPRPLPERVLGGQRLQVGEGVLVASEREPEQRHVLLRRDAQLLQAEPLGHRVRRVTQVGERLPVPGLQCPLQRDERAGDRVGIADHLRVQRVGDLAGRRQGGAHHVRERRGVHVLARQVEHVTLAVGAQHAGRLAPRPLGLQQPAQVGDVPLERDGRGGRGATVPERGGEVAHGDRTPQVQRQRGQQAPLLGRPERHGVHATQHARRAENGDARASALHRDPPPGSLQ